ncbi:MAG: AAA family ATPase [Marinibacterium sp.]
MTDFYVPRTDLAQAVFDQTRPDPVLGSQSGLFLAAPRRTGKSTFLRRELVPLLEANGLVTVYVDLWSDLDADPGLLIANAIAQALDDLSAGLAKAVRRHLPRSVAVGGIKVDLAAPEGQRTATLTQALSALGDRSGRDVALIIDEAQHALTTGAGRDAMFALKAARDEMNQRASGARLLLIFTGSHRDKLAGLLRGHKDPFFGSAVTEFPKLGTPYVSALVTALNARLAADNQLEQADVETAFALVGHQPEILTRLLRDHALGKEGSKGLHQTVIERADDLRRLRWDQHRSDYGALSDVQRAMLTVLARDGAEFAPFTADTLRRASEIIARKVTASDAQKALDALRDKSLVWRPTRGIYALEDQDMRDWLLAMR